MINLKVLSAISVVAASFGAQAAFRFEPKVIYGDDDRRDLYEVTDARTLDLADSTVALIKARDVSVQGETAKINSRTLRQVMNVCADEPYANQPSGGFCSGSLVAPDLIMTAGHCVESLAQCNTTKFVFGYAMKSANEAPNEVPASEVYGCKELVKQVYTNTVDYALIRLDRPVEGHTPLEINRRGNVAPGTDVGVIGHPSGLPTKVAFGGTVRSIKSGFFVASLDTYGGNSGSAVFNRTTGLVEGILVRGERDFVSRGGCSVSNRCTESGCRGEDVTLISELASFIPQN